MAASDVSITAANVKIVNAGEGQQSRAVSETVDAGEVCYLSGTSYALADADAASASANKGAIAMAVTSGGTTDPVLFARQGETVNVGAVLTANRTYYLSDTSGKILLESNLGELASGDSHVRVGYSISTSELVLDFKDYGTTA